MKKIQVVALALLVAVVLGCAPLLTMAAPAMTPIPQPAKPITFQPIAEQLGQQLQSLVQTPPAVATSEEGDEANQELPPTFGTRALNVVINITEILRSEGQRFITDFAALPQVSDWLSAQKSDPRLAARWQALGNDFLVTAGIAFLGALGADILLYPARRALRKRTPRTLSGRLAVVFSLFFLRALPILIFAGASVTLLNQYETQKLSRFIVMNAVYALALARITTSFFRGLLSPKSDTLRFVPATREQAVYGYRWLSSFSTLIILGYFLIDVAHVVHVPDAAVAAFINLLGLLLVVMGIVVIIQKRAFMAHLLRGNLSAAQHDLTWFESLRLWLARNWHVLAVAYLVIGYAVAAMGVQNGLSLMLRGTLVTLGVLVAARLLLREVGLWELRSKTAGATFYSLIKATSFRIVILVAAFFGVLAAWGVDLDALAASPLGHRLLGSAFSIGLTILILGFIYELFSTAVDHHLEAKTIDGQLIQVNSRSRTLLPMLRNTLFVLFLSILGVVVLSEAGINIGPLLAGAGVLGVAVGFGSQTLVKDFLIGLFIVLENTIAIGDVVKIGDHTGVVEVMSMRTMRLRDTDGSLHILPFSEASQIVNLTRGFSHALIKVNVTHDTNIDRAMDAMRAVGEAMQKDPAYHHMIIEPIEILGVDAINDTSLTLLARVRTLPGKQWDVKRKFLWLLKQRFDQDGIFLPYSTTLQILK